MVRTHEVARSLWSFGPARRGHRGRGVVLLLLIVAWVAGPANPTAAVHESTNRLTFAPVPESDRTSAAGEGLIVFHGGDEPNSQWTATFSARALDPESPYTVVVQGRFGEDGSAAATAFSPICTFTTDRQGNGGCWYYIVGLKRLAVAQIRAGAESGSPVLQATRAPGGPGRMTSEPNRYSPSPVASPSASPIASPPAATPVLGTAPG